MRRPKTTDEAKLARDRAADSLTWNEMNLAGAVCQGARVAGDDLALAWPANLRSRCRDELACDSPALAYTLGVRAMFDVACWIVNNDRHYYAVVWLGLTKRELVELVKPGELGRARIGWMTKRELVDRLLDVRFPRESWRAFAARHDAIFEGATLCAA